MNGQIIKSYIGEYKEKFDQIHSQEIYKWKAIKHFQNNWDTDSPEFFVMLSNSLAEVKNLMD